MREGLKYFTIGRRLPKFLAKPLFGNRAKFGTHFKENDPDWIEWEERYLDFYYQTQKKNTGKRVNDAGYKIMRRIDLDGMRVLEVGPGDIQHLRFWKGRPNIYTIVDVKEKMLERSRDRIPSP